MPASTVTIVVPALNAEATLSKCLESIFAQDYPRDSLNVIVVDNNSNDSTKEICKRFPVEYRFVERRNRSVARNTGAAKTRGEFIAFVDSDAFLDSKWISTLIPHFENSYLAGIQSHVVMLDGKAAPEVPSYPAVAHFHLTTPFLDTKGCIIRRTAFEAIGGFDETLERCEDLDASFRIFAGGGAIGFFGGTAVYTRTPGGILPTLKRNAESARAMAVVHLKWRKVFRLSVWKVIRGLIRVVFERELFGVRRAQASFSAKMRIRFGGVLQLLLYSFQAPFIRTKYLGIDAPFNSKIVNLSIRNELSDSAGLLVEGTTLSIVKMESGEAFLLRGAAKSIIEQLAAGISAADEIASSLEKEFECPERSALIRDIQVFFKEMAARGLLKGFAHG